MSLRIRYQFQTGFSLGFSIERLNDGSFFDFSDLTFKSAPVTWIMALPEDSGVFAGRYKVTLSPTSSSQFSDGDYAVSIHNTNAANIVVGQLATVMHSGNDATVFPGAGGGLDPWSTNLPGTYPSGSAGAILGGNLDSRVSTRSTYAGGPVASVSSPVTVGTNNDKFGYSLSATGLDGINIESGVNARQALSPILAASAGVLFGAGTGAIVIKGGNVALTRITATTDNAGNRTAVTLTLPS